MLGVPHSRLVLDVLPEPLAICRLGATAAIPDWATASTFSITRTRDELSIICPVAQVPEHVVASTEWVALKFRGPFDFNAVGVLLAVAEPLAAAGITIMAMATYDTDYVLVRAHELVRAASELTAAGHEIHGLPPS